MKFVHTQLRGAVGILTLDRPKVNALNKELIEGLTIALQEMNRQGIRAVVLRAKPGGKCILSGT
jgi:enoyl-CoA hydratase/carnithine racemase